MSLREAAQQALEALESLQGGCTDSDDGTVEAITVWCPEVIDALRAALTETNQDWSLLEATQESLREHMAEIQTLRATLKQDADRWRWLVRHASLGFDAAPSWNAVVRLPVFDSDDQTITALVDRARAFED